MDLDRLIEVISQEYDINPAQLLGRCRTEVYSEARQMYMHILRKECGYAESEIAWMTGRHINTVKHNLDTFESLLKYDRDTRQIYDDVLGQM